MHPYFTAYAGKAVTVIGLGVSHRALVRRLAEAGAHVTVCDRDSAVDPSEWEALGVTLRFGEGYLENLDSETVFRTPSMRPDHPVLLRAKASGAVVTSEMNEFFAHSPCPIIAVTGSDGKTTTTSLIAAMLAAGGKTVHLGGNIGAPLLPRLDTMNPEDICAAELSSFQLMDMIHSPAVAVITNITPNHLDWHRDMDEYMSAKSNILRHQTATDLAVLNDDNPASLAYRGMGRTLRFGGYMVADGFIDGLIPMNDIKLRGWHNVENILAARLAVRGLVSEEAICSAACAFEGVGHRDQWVAAVNGADYYNDSIGSSPSRTMATLRAHPDKVILIAGGRGKNLSFEAFAALLPDRVSHLILMGEASADIEAAARNVESAPPITRCQDLPEAVRTAHALALPGDTVLLSPACTSFDSYKNFEERGDHFVKLVSQLNH